VLAETLVAEWFVGIVLCLLAFHWHLSSLLFGTMLELQLKTIDKRASFSYLPS
jgi:hypothetical protein